MFFQPELILELEDAESASRNVSPSESRFRSTTDNLHAYSTIWHRSGLARVSLTTLDLKFGESQRNRSKAKQRKQSPRELKRAGYGTQVSHLLLVWSSDTASTLLS